MSGQAETLSYSDNGAVTMVGRGNAGAALINFSDKEQKLSIATTLPDGTYTDAVSGKDFKVSKGKISGKLSPLTTYILYNK